MKVTLLMQEFDDADAMPTLRERPWIVLATTFDVEAWIDHFNRDLQQVIGKKITNGAGVCFTLQAGGEIYLHTTSEGVVLLDVTEEAQWISPLITAATNQPSAESAWWTLPGEVLTQLVLGLSPLIASTRLVVGHTFKPTRNKRL